MRDSDIPRDSLSPTGSLRPGVEAAWGLQLAMFLFGAPPFLFPSSTFDVFTGESQARVPSLRVAHDFFALLCIHAMAFGAMSAFALRSRDGVFRLGFARASSVFLVVWMAALGSGIAEAPERYGLAAGVLFLPGLFMLTLNVRHAVRATRRRRTARGGAAVPTWMAVWWWAQAAASVAVGVATFVAATTVCRQLVEPAMDVHVMAPHQFRFSSAYAVLYGALNVMAARASRRGAWRLVTVLLTAWPAITLAVILLRWNLSLYTPLTWRLLGVGGVVAVLNGVAAVALRTSWGDAYDATDD